jgi:type II secretory pathway pseudopilin PulG
MRIKNLNSGAFSLLEVLLASIIFIITIGGLFATLNAVRAPVSEKENALAAAIYGKQVLDALRSQVNTVSYFTCSSGAGTVGSPCTDFSLYLGNHQVSPIDPKLTSANVNMPSVLTGLNHTLNYTVYCADGSGSTYTACSTPCSGTCSISGCGGLNADDVPHGVALCITSS